MKIAFYFAFRDTLVCPDIDIATSIAYGPTRLKCVTLNGVVIDSDGVMSGGLFVLYFNFARRED